MVIVKEHHVVSTKPTPRIDSRLAKPVLAAVRCGVLILTVGSSSNFAEVPSPLNSDQITARFGSYGVEVLQQGPTTRLANLYSEHASGRVCRTLALTQFVTPIPEALTEPDQRIRLGASIGATLRQAGWAVTKRHSVSVTTEAGLRFAQLAQKTVDPKDIIEVRVYTLGVQRDTMAFDYAIIAEAYHPEHVAPSLESSNVSALGSQLDDEQRQAVTALLDALR